MTKRKSAGRMWQNKPLNALIIAITTRRPRRHCQWVDRICRAGDWVLFQVVDPPFHTHSIVKIYDRSVQNTDCA